MQEALVVTRRLEGEGCARGGCAGRALADLAARGSSEESRDWAEQSLEVRVEHGLSTVGSLAELGSIALAEDELDRAEKLLVEVRDIFAREGQPNAAVASRQLAEVERRRGNNEQAVDHANEALRGFGEVGDRAIVGECLSGPRMSREGARGARTCRPPLGGG